MASLYFPKQPTNEYEGKLKLSYGNSNTVYGQFSFSGPVVEDKVLFRVSGSHKRSDGFVKNVALDTFADRIRDTYLHGLILFDMTENISLDLRANYGYNDNGNLSAEGFVTRAQFDDFDPGFIKLNADTFTIREMYDFSAKLNIEGEYLTLTSITSYSNVMTDLEGDADFTPLPIVLQDVESSIKAITQELRLSSSSDSDFRWLVGVFYQDRDVDKSLNIPFDDGTGHPLPALAQSALDFGTSKSWAVFGSASYDITPELELTFGLRYDSDKRTSVDANIPGSDAARKFTSTQPKVQLKYQLRPDLNIYATYGRGFRSGGFNAFVSIAEDRAYAGETADNYEVGIKGSMAGGKVSFSASAFRIDFNNQQFFFVSVNPPTQNIQNIEKNQNLRR